MIHAIGNKPRIKKLFGNRPEIERILFLSCSFGFLLLAIRVIATGSLMYGFLGWNLFLAYLPYAVTNRLVKNQQWIKDRLTFFSLFLCWLLFIPNSFYIITDLFHLDEGKAAPQWFDLALIFSFVWNGLLFGVLSLGEMERIIESQFKAKWSWVFAYVIMWLNALGIYIGRYLRFNSWDVITNPFQLAGDILYLCIHPLRNGREWGMIICYAIPVTMIYKSLLNTGREVFK